MLSHFSCVRLCNPRDCNPPGSSVLPGKNTGVGCHFLLQGIFPIQGSNLCLLCLLHWQVGYLPPGPPRKPQSTTMVIDKLENQQRNKTNKTDSQTSLFSSWMLDCSHHHPPAAILSFHLSIKLEKSVCLELISLTWWVLYNSWLSGTWYPITIFRAPTENYYTFYQKQKKGYYQKFE